MNIPRHHHMPTETQRVELRIATILARQKLAHLRAKRAAEDAIRRAKS